MFNAIRAWFYTTFCYTLTVPEYKGFHVAKTAEEYWDWRLQYPRDAQTISTVPRVKLW